VTIDIQAIQSFESSKNEPFLIDVFVPQGHLKRRFVDWPGSFVSRILQRQLRLGHLGLLLINPFDVKKHISLMSLSVTLTSDGSRIFS